MPFTDFTLGSDPELMLRDVSGNLRSAIGVISGTKKHPLSLEEGMAQHDNVNAEFGIDPASSEDDWVGRHGRVMRQLDTLIGKDLRLSCTASAFFPESELDCEEARQFACDPDFDPYDVMPNVIPPSASEGSLRSCGGHIHLGNEAIADDFDKKIAIVKTFDIFLDRNPTVSSIEPLATSG